MTGTWAKESYEDTGGWLHVPCCLASAEQLQQDTVPPLLPLQSSSAWLQSQSVHADLTFS